MRVLSITSLFLSQQLVISRFQNIDHYSQKRKIPPHPAQNRILASTEKTLFSDIYDSSQLSTKSHIPSGEVPKSNFDSNIQHRRQKSIDEHGDDENRKNNESMKPLSPPSKEEEKGWWNKLGEMPDPEYDFGIPSSRRSLSSAIYKRVKTVDTFAIEEEEIHTSETNSTENDGEEMLNNEKLKVKDELKDAEQKKESSQPEFEYQEWMIVSGGFTDEDWSTFPVWAYDITESRTTGKGTWIPLQLIPPSHHKKGSYPSDSESDENDYDEDTIGPTARVGHMSVVNDGYLYVFGGLMFKEGVFFPDSEFVIWRTKISDLLGKNKTEVQQLNDHIRLKWEVIGPIIGSDVSASALKKLPRGESEGDLYYKKEIDSKGNEYEKPLWIFHGGLTTKISGTSIGHHMSPTLSVDIPLSDMWSYDFETNTLELLDVACDLETFANCGTSPIARTAHAGKIVKNEFIIYGGMTTFFDADFFGEMSGGQKWEMLSDVWSFDLITKTWRKWDMNQALGRSYHSLVGWEPIIEDEGDKILEVIDQDSNDEKDINEKEKDGRNRGSIVSYGGFRTYETVGGESIAFVFSDVLISHPPKRNASYHGNEETLWYKAQWPPGSPEAVSHRLEHSSVIDSTGSMYVWGGRFQDVNQITGIYSINIFGPQSTVQFKIAETDGLDAYEAQLEKLHLLVAVMILMSILFTALYGTLRRQAEEGANGDGNGVSMFVGRRRGVTREIIETIPVKKYSKSKRSCCNTETNTNTNANADLSQGIANNANENNEEGEVCPICLLEYEEGDEIRCLPCNHFFHKDCVDSWLVNNSSCPTCRQSICTNASDDSSPPNNFENEIGTDSFVTSVFVQNDDVSRRDEIPWLFSRRNRRLIGRRWFGTLSRGLNGHATVSDNQYINSLDLEVEGISETEMTQQNLQSNNEVIRAENSGRSETSNAHVLRGRGGIRRGRRMRERDASLNSPLTDSSIIV